MRISERRLIEMATAYIEDGIVKKWRHFSYDKESLMHKIEAKRISGEKLTEEEFEFIKTFDNVVIVNERMVQFINFSGYAFRY